MFKDLLIPKNDLEAEQMIKQIYKSDHPISIYKNRRTMGDSIEDSYIFVIINTHNSYYIN